MSLDQGMRFNNGFGFGGQFPAFQENVQLDNLHRLMNEVEVHERENFTSPVRTETFPSDYSSQMGRTFFSPGFSSSEQNPLQSLLDHNFSQQPHGGSYSNWSNAEHNISHNGGSFGFPSQVLTKKEPFGSKFSDNSESSLFSGSVNLATLEPEFSKFSASPLSKPQSSSGATSYNDNQLGLSDITKRLEGLSNVPLSPQSKSRGSTPSSWHPMMSISSKASSLTPSPVAGLSHAQGTFLPQALPKSQSSRVQLFMGKEDNYITSSDDEEKIQHMLSATPQKQLRPGLQLSKCISQQQQCQSAPCSPQPASWSQVVRTSSLTPATPSPPPRPQPEPQLVVEEVPHSPATVDYHRGPRVDPRWPVAQQVFLGPIPMSISWDEIRNVFYTKVQRKELLHFYVQSKPVNEVVYGQVVFDKASLTSKILKDGPVKVRGVLINVTSMKEKLKFEKKK